MNALVSDIKQKVRGFFQWPDNTGRLSIGEVCKLHFTNLDQSMRPYVLIATFTANHLHYGLAEKGEHGIKK